MSREPTLGELADDLVEIRGEVRLMREAMHRDFVPRDLHNEQVGNIQANLAGLRTAQAEGFAALNGKFMWIIGILGMVAVAIVVAAVTNAMGGAA